MMFAFLLMLMTSILLFSMLTTNASETTIVVHVLDWELYRASSTIVTSEFYSACITVTVYDHQMFHTDKQLTSYPLLDFQNIIFL